MKLKVYSLDPRCMPAVYHKGDAGLDLRAKHGTFLRYNTPTKVPVGIHIEIPLGYVGLIFARSGLSFKHNVKLVNGVGVIDSGYRGEIMCAMEFKGPNQNSYQIKQYDRIAQLVIVPIPNIEIEKAYDLYDLEESDRGMGGFGSTENG